MKSNPLEEALHLGRPSFRKNLQGSQRLSPEQIREWESWRFGLFLHFGMSTYDGVEHSAGTAPATLYNPTHLDPDQWVSIARDAGMRYAVLTVKHTSGFCLWPSKHTGYHVGNSPNPTDVVEKFRDACERRGVKPGLYYAQWDNHHTFGSVTPRNGPVRPDAFHYAYTTPAYWDFQRRQLEELLENYGSWAEIWIDIPLCMPRGIREEQYRWVTEAQPRAVYVANGSIYNHGTHSSHALDAFKQHVWPTDVVTLERNLPPSFGHEGTFEMEGNRHYLPAEVCDTLGREWFYGKDDEPRSQDELLGMALIARSRNANLLLNVPPAPDGRISERDRKALFQWARRVEQSASAQESPVDSLVRP